MTLDHFFTIGSAHHAQGTPCEDYALSGMLPSGVAFGVVADGCSGAEANTDVGARAISWAFKQALAESQAEAGHWFDAGFTERLQAAFVRNQFAGAREDYLATVVGFAATPDFASVYVHGDGAVALRYADGRMELIQFAWWDNTPYYLNYQVHTEWLDRFLAPYQDGVIEPFGVRHTTFQAAEEGVEVLQSRHERFAMDQVMGGHVLQFRPAEEGIVAMAVLTDGIEQVGEKAPLEVASEWLAYKNFRGEFVKRRMLKSLKVLRNGGFIPRDDIGIAAISFVEIA
jgi:hypothetical protein